MRLCTLVACSEDRLCTLLNEFSTVSERMKLAVNVSKKYSYVVIMNGMLMEVKEM